MRITRHDHSILLLTVGNAGYARTVVINYVKMKSKKIEDVTLEDLKDFYSRNKIESAYIEYKRILNISNREEIKELLADISSFANSSGGYLIFGIDEENGIVGFKSESIDKTILRIEESVRNNIEPRINIGLKHFELEDGNTILIVKIAKSWNKPHQIKIGSYRRFISRGNNGKFELDINQIRSAFIGTHTIEDKINDFFLNRITKLKGDELPIALKSRTILALQIVPLDYFISNNQIDIFSLYHNYNDFWPMGSRGSYQKFNNFDGILAYNGDESYVQIYRSGIIESVSCDFFSDEEKIIHSSILVYDFFKSLDRHLAFYSDKRIEYPLILKLSILNIEGFKLASDGFSARSKQIINDDLIFPSIVIDSQETVLEKLKSWFDQLWQSFGYLKCIHYDNDGKLKININ